MLKGSKNKKNNVIHSSIVLNVSKFWVFFAIFFRRSLFKKYWKQQSFTLVMFFSIILIIVEIILMVFYFRKINYLILIFNFISYFTIRKTLKVTKINFLLILLLMIANILLLNFIKS